MRRPFTIPVMCGLLAFAAACCGLLSPPAIHAQQWEKAQPLSRPAKVRRVATLTPPRIAATPAPPLKVIISEFRTRGVNDAGSDSRDEYVEIFNNTDAPVTVSAADGSGGWAVVSKTEGVLFVIPDGTTIGARRHLLATNPIGYSLDSVAFGDINYADSISNDSDEGLALFNTASPANFTVANRLDAVGFSGAPALFREGAGLKPIFEVTAQQCFVRRFAGFDLGDSDDNAADFFLVSSTNHHSFSAGAVLNGAPGPQNSSSPVLSGAIAVALLDPSLSSAVAPNRERRPNYVQNGDLGTLIIRRTITNTTSQPVTRLRFRVMDITTIGTPDPCPPHYISPCADLRVLDATDETSGSPNIGLVTVRGLTLERSAEQPAGGGHNSAVSADFITLATPLPPGGSVHVRFVLGVMRSGYFRFFLHTELL